MENGSTLPPTTRGRFGLAGYNQRLLSRGSLDPVRLSALADALEEAWSDWRGFQASTKPLGRTYGAYRAVALLFIDELAEGVD